MEVSDPSLLGKDWLGHIQLDWRQIQHIHTSSLQKVLNRHKPVFEGGLGTMEWFKDKIYVDPIAHPRFIPARSDKVDKELDRLQEEGILELVEILEWAAPIVPILKQDKQSICICRDF